MTTSSPLSARGIADALRRGEGTAVETARAALTRAAGALSLGAFLDLDEASILAAARDVDRRLEAGESLPLAGVPVAIKDNLCVAGRPTTCGSRLLEGWIPPYDATVVARLRAAGAVPFGKTNCDEFAMGSSNENSAFGPVRNPWNEERVPGGSSGGSAAAVAAGIVPVALGSDTGGSVRQPASFCGVVGLKPTWGRVSRYGLVAFASSLDQVGTLASSVEDAAALLAILAGRDPLDATSAEDDVPDLGGLADEPLPLRFGVPSEAFGEGLAPDVRREVLAACAVLEGLGAERVDVSLPHAPVAVATYYVVATAEASSNLARFDGVRFGRRAPGAVDVEDLLSRTRGEGFGAEVRRRILLGTFVLSAGYHDAYYRRAHGVRALVAQDFEHAFARCDVLLGPTTPTTAFRLGEKSGDPLAMYLSDVHTVPSSLAGLPALSLPCGLGDDGLPVGLQLTAPRWQERRLLATAARLERALGFVPRGAR